MEGEMDAHILLYLYAVVFWVVIHRSFLHFFERIGIESENCMFLTTKQIQSRLRDGDV